LDQIATLINIALLFFFALKQMSLRLNLSMDSKDFSCFLSQSQRSKVHNGLLSHSANQLVVTSLKQLLVAFQLNSFLRFSAETGDKMNDI
jgi:hypothetical protein